MKATGKITYKASVAIISSIGDKFVALDRAVNAAVEGGLHFAIAAGTCPSLKIPAYPY
jgi:cerevisin